MSNVKDESSPQKRGRMTFLTKDDLRLQLGEYCDKRARAFQLLQKSEESLKSEVEKNRQLEVRLKNAEERNVKLVKTFEKLVQEISRIHEKHEKGIKEKDETFKEWIKIYTKECKDKIDAEKDKSDIEKAKWLGEMHQMLENERAKKIANTSVETQTTSKSTAIISNDETMNDEILDENSILPLIDTTECSATVIPCISVAETTTPNSVNTDIAIPQNLENQIKQRCLQIRTLFSSLPKETQTKMKSEADRLVLLIQRGKKVPQQNWIMILLIANRLNPDSFNIEK